MYRKLLVRDSQPAYCQCIPPDMHDADIAIATLTRLASILDTREYTTKDEITGFNSCKL